MAQYSVENQWGGEDAPWNFGGNWVVGGRTGQQKVVQLSATSNDGGMTLNGTMTYEGEGLIGFKAVMH
ncbi:hypothetical protein DSM106972_062930 [Dulcicalothrix desertica PCC 7102]|uniref:OAA-family lectin sugar binding domain-containing protein n=1 Tax=Dulcicalothrix desertica PCC 7102 TaxID=232991 RepID=A0A3S1AJP6_9CYAN|nr:hypothetical protein [Dulcicalothrix desertica]RUT02218.1 hypothetical protein DSM106972_062930 [Dulcicalothrix desertica PCC 7102]TWH53857.1 hypothetical protein CAL7102_01848 [Dulcicalothrix desertica PCC 7102]